MVNWSYVGAAGVLFIGLAAINEITGTNWGWYIALFVGAGVLLSSGGGNKAIAFITGKINALANAAR